MRADGHSIHWGRATDGRSAFYWARVTPRRTAGERNVRAADADGLVAKVHEIVTAPASEHVVAALSDPLRSCLSCGSQLSFEGGDTTVFACPRAGTGPGHTVVRPL